MSETEKSKGAEGDKPKESKDEKPKDSKGEKQEKPKKEKDQKTDPKDAKADAKGKPEVDENGEAKAEPEPKSKSKVEPKAKPKGEFKSEGSAKTAVKAKMGTADRRRNALNSELAVPEGKLTDEGEEGEGALELGPENEPAAEPGPPPKLPLPRQLLYGLVTVVFGISIYLYYPERLFTILDVLWFGPFVLVAMGLMKAWKDGLFDRRGQALLVGGILSHFALLLWTDGNVWVATITVPILVVWAGALVFAKGLQIWLKSRQHDEAVAVPEAPPVRARKRRWTYEDMNELLAEVGDLSELPELDVAGYQEAAGASGESAKDAESQKTKEQ